MEVTIDTTDIKKREFEGLIALKVTANKIRETRGRPKKYFNDEDRRRAYLDQKNVYNRKYYQRVTKVENSKKGLIKI